ncbi:hypothetical protein OS121_29460 [Mycolicibacterium mucogenicum]|uniref:hypothetical protein n=1 Tax=Mycolicibacterium mucogenicum TaxID=56689 RepID=UPI00226A8273|nr:hypothetical protein [Mycolicibacterium mucogenicum]MCX8559176.1 hypothetical protein [Mycolicibacterium mucogenicum]
MTATYATPATTANHPYETPEFRSLPQTVTGYRKGTVWGQLQADFATRSATRSARNEYAQWRSQHGWTAPAPDVFAAELRDNPDGLGVIVAYHQNGSQLASAILVEAFRPALITFSRYARIDAFEQLSRNQVRAQVVLSTFYEVVATTSPDHPNLVGRLYGETLKRVTREHAQVAQYCASHVLDWREERPLRSSLREEYALSEHLEGHLEGGPGWTGDFKDPASTGPDWDAIERAGLARDLIDSARDRGVISAIEYDLISARFLGDTLVPVPTIARAIGRSTAYCDSKIRRAIQKIADAYGTTNNTVAATNAA